MAKTDTCTRTLKPRYFATIKILLFSVCLLVLQSNASTEAVHDINFLFITSFGQYGFNSSGVIPAADIALEGINNDPNILPGYRLTYGRERDSQFYHGQSLNAFFGGIQSDPVKIAVVGCGCSVATEPVAEISHYWNISQISYATTLAALSDRSRFPSYFRNDLPIAAPALRSTLDHFNWTRIAFLTQDESLFTVAESTFRNELEPFGITVVSRRFKTTEDPVKVIKDLFGQDYRVFFLNSYSGIARRIICYAQSQNYTFPRYIFMVYDWYPPKWWTYERSKIQVNCKDQDLTNFIERSLSFQFRPVSDDDDNVTTDTGKSLAEFETEYERRRRKGGYYNITLGITGLYDGLWALAFALNHTMTMVNSEDINKTGCQNASGSLVPLHNFTYRNEMMGCLIHWNLHETNFSGLTGNVRFDENGTRIYPKVRVLQYQRTDGTDSEIMRQPFAFLDISDSYSFKFLPGVSDNDIFPGGVPPDGTPVNITNTFKLELIVIFDTLAVLGIVFAIACLLFNILFRKQKIVKLTSPNLNYFIIAGAILMYMSIFFYLFPSRSGIVVHTFCALHRWFFNIGYTLAFGTVFAKMWRVYHIFHNPQPKKKILTDWHLIGISLAVTGIDIILLSIGKIIPILRDHVSLERDTENPQAINELGVREVNHVLVCFIASSPSFYWEIIIFAYLAVLQILGLMLAFQTRKVKLPGLKDSKFVAAIIYISSIMVVVLALVTFFLRTYINVGTGMSVFGIFSLTTVFLALIFVPKMVLLWRDPKGENVTSVHIVTETVQSSEMATLQKTISQKDDLIAQLKDEISLLKRSKTESFAEE